MKRALSVCVFCGSRPGKQAHFVTIAEELGRELARRGHTLVYGGAKVGMMGAVAAGALGAGGRAVGVIPKSLVTKEIAHDGLTELFLTETMFARKERMMALSDAFIALPGGFGTYDELFETITLGQIGFHEKPNGLLNIDGFFDPLLALFKQTIDHEYAAPEHMGLLVVENTVNALLDAISAWTPPPRGTKELDRR